MVDSALADINFLNRVQESFDPEDMTEDKIREWLYHGESGKHKVKWGFTDSGKQRYKEIEGKSIHPNTIELVEQLSITKTIYNNIEGVNIKNIDEVRDSIEGAPTHQSDLKTLLESKEKEIRVVRLKKKGKILSILTDELKIVKTEDEIINLISKAENELGPGRNLDSFLERVEIKREII